jgi:hypothetical protein
MKKLDLLYNQYKIYLSEEDEKSDFVVIIKNFNPDINDCLILDDKYYIKYNYFYSNDKRKFAEWKLEIRNFDEGTIFVYLSVNFWGNLSVAVNLIDFLIHFKMAEKGIPLIHASGALIDSKAYVFAGRSGCGKTTIITYLLEKEYSYFGDNFVVLNEGNVCNFISPLNLFSYNMTPLIKNNLKYIDKIEMFCKNALYKLSGGYIKIFTKMNLSEILPDKIAKSAKLNGIYLLIPAKEFTAAKISRNELIEHLVYNQQLEFMHLPLLNYLSAYAYVFPESKIHEHWDHYRTALEKSIPENITIFRITTPLRPGNTVVEKIINLIKG